MSTSFTARASARAILERADRRLDARRFQVARLRCAAATSPRTVIAALRERARQMAAGEAGGAGN